MISKFLSTLCIFYLGLPLAGQEIYFEDDFESGLLDPNFWQASQSGVKILIGEAAEGQYSAFIGGRENATLDLTLDLSGTNQAELRFAYRDYGDTQNPLTGLWLSEDGGAHFVKVFSFLPEVWGTCWGEWPPFDLDKLAAKAGLRFNSRFVIRFRQESPAAAGMGLDFVRITRPVEPTYASLPFRDFFETGLGNAWRWRLPFPGLDHATSPCGLAHITNNAISEAYSLVLGKRVSGAYSTNAMDLHLNLAGHDRVVLQFMIGVLDESEHTDDGLFLSDDGGENFVKAFSFKESMWDMPGYGGKLPPLELGRLAKTLGLELTDRFIIRFQQSDDGATFFGEDRDGIWLDEIEITAPPLTYARPPFEDGFEQGALASMWAWRDPSPTSFNLRNSGIVRVSDDFFGFRTARNGNYGVMFVKAGVSGNKITANALDLHLNLADLDNVEVSFFLKDFGWEEAEPEDGIYLQVNENTGFVKILSLTSDLLAGNDFREVALPLSRLADESGLRLGARCVLRFQQVGRNSPSQFFEHGWIIDDVFVTGTPTIAQLKPIAVVPWVVDNSAFTTRIAIFNDGQDSTDLELYGIDETGQTRRELFSLPAKSLYSVAAGDLFAGMSRYSLTVSSINDTVFTSMLTFNIEPRSGGSSPSQTTAEQIDSLSSYLLFGYLPSDQFSAVVLVAPEVVEGSTRVILELYGEDGRLWGETTKTLHANAPFAALLSDLFSALPSEAALVARAPDGTLLAGTTFIFNHQGQPSMSNPFSR